MNLIENPTKANQNGGQVTLRSLSRILAFQSLFLFTSILPGLSFGFAANCPGNARFDERDVITISVNWPEASANEVEEGANAKIVEALSSNSEFDLIESRAEGGRGLILVYSKLNRIFGPRARRSLISELDQIRSFPKKVNTLVDANAHRRPNGIIAIRPAGGEKKPTEQLKLTIGISALINDVKKLNGIESIKHKGISNQIRLTVDQDRLARNGLTMESLSAQIRQNQFESRSGEREPKSGAKGKNDFLLTMEQIPIRVGSGKNAGQTRLGELCEVTVGPKFPCTLFNDAPAIVLPIYLKSLSTSDEREAIGKVVQNRVDSSSTLASADIFWFDNGLVSDKSSHHAVAINIEAVRGLPFEKALKSFASEFRKKLTDTHVVLMNADEMHPIRADMLLIGTPSAKQVDFETVCQICTSQNIFPVLLVPQEFLIVNKQVTSRAPIECVLFGNNDEQLQKLAGKLKARIEAESDVSTVVLRRATQKAYKLNLEIKKDMASRLGLQDQVIYSFFSTAMQRSNRVMALQMGDVEVEVVLRYKQMDWNTIGKWSMPTKDGAVPLERVADVRIENVNSLIRKVNGRPASKFFVCPRSTIDKRRLGIELKQYFKDAAAELNLNEKDYSFEFIRR